MSLRKKQQKKAIKMNEDPLAGLKQLQKEFKEKFAEFDKDLANARIISRDVVYKIILLCSTIIGFSLTLISLPQVGIHTDIVTLRYSWYLLLATIVLGFLSIFVEGRLHYALKWRSFQVQDFDKEYLYPPFDKIKVWAVCAYSLIFPRNLIFCRIYPDPKVKKQNELLNAKAVQMLAELEKLTFIFEDLFIVMFIGGLIVFVASYR